jgi:SAM-dependent methyltransferase
MFGKVMLQARGTKQDGGALDGKGLLQSPEEWRQRNDELSSSLNCLIRQHLACRTSRALDVGCMSGELTDKYGDGLNLLWWGIDPDIEESQISPLGASLQHGYGHELAFRSNYFDCITFANVYEHIPPALRQATLREFNRVLVPGGILVGQLPNPYFPIESHSRLPFLGYLPRWAQRLYWPLTPTGWCFKKSHFFSVTVRSITKIAEANGFRTIIIRNFNYSPAAIPLSVRWLAKVHSRIGFPPWAWQFVFAKM